MKVGAELILPMLLADANIWGANGLGAGFSGEGWYGDTPVPMFPLRPVLKLILRPIEPCEMPVGWLIDGNGFIDTAERLL